LDALTAFTAALPLEIALLVFAAALFGLSFTMISPSIIRRHFYDTYAPGFYPLTLALDILIA